MGALLVLLLVTAADPIARAKEQLAAFDERGAIRTLEQARSAPDLTPSELAVIHLYLGLAYAALADEKSAVADFKHAVLLDPELELPNDASPTVERWWSKAGGHARLVPAPATAEPPQPIAPVATTVQPAPEPSTWRRWVAGSLCALGGVSLIGGLISGITASNLHNQARAEEFINVANELQDQAKGMALVANVLYAVGALFAVAGVLLFVLPSDT